MSKTRVVNKHRDRFDIIVMRPGPFGNPYPLDDCESREECLRLFEDYFMDRVERDPDFRQQVLDLKGKALGCCCRPAEGFQGRRMCHAQVIAAYLEDCEPEEIS